MKQSTPMGPSDKGDSDQQPFVKLKPNKGLIKLNETINNNNTNATTSVPPISKFFKREMQFTPLNESLHSIMSQLLQRNIIKIPPIGILSSSMSHLLQKNIIKLPPISLFRPTEKTPSIPIDYFWPQQFQSLPTRNDALF